MNKNFISVTEAAHIIGYQRQTIMNWIRSGKLHAERVGRSWLIDRTVLMAYRPERTARGRAQVMPQYLRVKYGNNTQAIELRPTTEDSK